MIDWRPGGNIFGVGADVLVNPVNCVGVMGKGLAAEVKRRWPTTYMAYRRACWEGYLSPGGLFPHRLDVALNVTPKEIWHVATKNHWRNASRIEWVELALQNIADELRDSGHRSISIPALGCGLGGLSWADVRPLVEEHLKPLSDAHSVIVLEPPE